MPPPIKKKFGGTTNPNRFSFNQINQFQFGDQQSDDNGSQQFDKEEEVFEQIKEDDENNFDHLNQEN